MPSLYREDDSKSRAWIIVAGLIGHDFYIGVFRGGGLDSFLPEIEEI
jgi:hypothetical protein